MSLLGIDIGTTGCKSAAFSVEGACLASAYREYGVEHPRPDWAELDSRRVLALVEETVAEVAANTSADPITAISFSSLGEAMTPISEDREILGNSILMTDLRGANYAERLRAEIGQEAFFRINPNLLGPSYSLPKLLWLRDHQREVFERTWKFLLWSDLVAVHFGGEPLTSHSLANRTLLYDIHREEWSSRLLSWAGLDRGTLPRPVPSGTLAGTMRDSLADRLGLPRRVALVVGGHDQCCNSLGCGVHQPNRAVCGMGTFQCITPVYDHIPDASRMLAHGLNVEHHVLPGLYVSFLFNQSGSLVRWFRDTFAAAERDRAAAGEDVYDLLTAEMPSEPSELLVLPHFEITGPPAFITDSAGVIAGLRTHTTRGEILKAIMESVALYFVDGLLALEGMGIDLSELIASGGGARSDAWLQIQADVFGVPFVRPVFTECSILGAAMLAGMATGVFSGAAEAVEQFVRRETCFEPDTRRHEIYREKHSSFQKLYPALRRVL
jgi:xylulokinase